jgi:hypothetical protein
MSAAAVHTVAVFTSLSFAAAAHLIVLFSIIYIIVWV